MKTGASTAQLLDEARAGHDQARSAVDRARDLRGARRPPRKARSPSRATSSRCCGRSASSPPAQLAELEVTRRQVRHPRAGRRHHGADASSSGRASWRSRAAPSSRCSIPTDKYVQVYVPVARPRRRCASATRSRSSSTATPGQRVPGEVSFVADQATFTPEKIESRSDRLGQVYRAKVRILEDVERFQPGTEGNVYLRRAARATRGARRAGGIAAVSDADRDPPARAREASTDSGGRSPASTSCSTARRSSASSVPTAPARPRCCARSSASSRCSADDRARARPRPHGADVTRAEAARSATCRRRSACTATCR